MAKLKTSMKCSVLGFSIVSIVVGIFSISLGGFLLVVQYGDFTSEFGDICTLYRVDLIRVAKNESSYEMKIQGNSANSLGRPSAHLTCPAISKLIKEYYGQKNNRNMSKDAFKKLGDHICYCRSGRMSAVSLSLVAGILQLISGVMVVIFRRIKLQVEVQWSVFGKCHVAAAVLSMIAVVLCINFKMADRLKGPPTQENPTKYTHDNLEGKLFTALCAVRFVWTAFIAFFFVLCTDCLKIFEKKRHKKGSRNSKKDNKKDENQAKISQHSMKMLGDEPETTILPLEEVKAKENESLAVQAMQQEQEPALQTEANQQKVEEEEEEEEPSENYESPPAKKPAQNNIIQYPSKFVQAALNRK